MRRTNESCPPVTRRAVCGGFDRGAGRAGQRQHVGTEIRGRGRGSALCAGRRRGGQQSHGNQDSGGGSGRHRSLSLTGGPKRACAPTSASLLSLQFIEAFPCVLCVLARPEFLEQAFEQRDCLRFLIGSGEAFRQIEVHFVPPGEFRVLLENATESRDRARAPAARGNSGNPTRNSALAQTVARFTPFRPHLGRQGCCWGIDRRTPETLSVPKRSRSDRARVRASA